MKKIFLLIITVSLMQSSALAQVTVTNPTNTTPNLAATYTSLANAITALNSITAISGPVTITLTAGNPQTAPAGGYAIQFTATTTAANNITIEGSGNTITASNALTVGALNDAIFKLIGADYITLQNFTMQENAANTVNTPAASNTMTEWGVALLHSSTTDGAQNNTIQNNTISLNRTYFNTFGIYSNVRHSATAITTTQDITNNTTAPNSGNKFYANAISNVNMGITLIGSGTAANQDVGNDIGGSSAATGNTITNWGGAAALSGYVSNSGVSYCIFSNHQTADNISYNTLTSATAGAGVSLTFAGIRKDYTTAAPTGTFTSTISHNTITMTSAFTGGNFECIRSQGMTLSTGVMNITDNTLLNNAVTAAGTTSAFGGIICGSACGTLSVTNNIMQGLTSVSSGGFTGISNSGAVVNTINITNNQIGNASGGALTQTVATASQMNCITNSGAASTANVNITGNSFDGFSVVSYGQTAFVLNTSGAGGTINLNNNLLGSTTGSLITYSGTMAGAFFGIYTQGSPAGATTSIQNNDIRGIVHSVTGTGSMFLMTNNHPVLSQTISNNTFTNLSLNTTGIIFFMQQNGAMVSGASFTCNNNSIVTAFSKPATGGQVEFLHCTGTSVAGSTITETGNNFSNVTLTGNPPLFGWNESSGTGTGANGPAKTITGNTFNNITMGTGLAAVMYIWRGTTINCSSNTVSNINGPVVYGIMNETTGTGGDFTFSNNTIFNLTSTGDITAMVGGTGVTSTNINNNTIYNLSSSGASAIVTGIDASATTANINDNIIHGLSVSGTTSPSANGILIKGGTTVNVYKNKIYDIAESGAISTTSPAVNGIVISAGTLVNTYNNFIADLKAPNANLIDAIRGISVTSTTASTVYNLYYNSIYINAASTGTNFGSSGIYHAANATATTAALNMIDNIVVNTSTPNGTGVTAAYRRSGTALDNYLATSDYNLLYAGTPSASKLIFYDGTNSDQTLAAFQARVSTREANDLSLMPNFTSATDLHLTPNNCIIDNRGFPIAGILTDIDAATRDILTPDIGADEFTSTPGTTLAGVVGSATCENRAVAVTGTTYYANTCDLIARVVPSGGSAVTGNINVCVTRDASVQTFNAEPYVARHFDIEPATNASTATARVTLYFTNQEFVDFNAASAGFPLLPTVAGGGNADPNIANLKVTQYHGTPTSSPSSPGMYTFMGGQGFLIDPADVDIVWNGLYWAVTVDVTGFSGFYVHTNISWPLSITLNYLRGVKQGDKNNLSWKVTCNSTPKATLTLERSSDATNFSAIYTITADALRCQQPFDHLDANPLAGKNYYRLKMVDNNGKITYSNIITLLNSTKGFEVMNIAPNPITNGQFKLNVTSAENTKLNVVITDIQGRVVQKQTMNIIAGYNSLDMSVTNLASGTYNIYGTTDSDKSKVIRFVKQ